MQNRQKALHTNAHDNNKKTAPGVISGFLKSALIYRQDNLRKK